MSLDTDVAVNQTYDPDRVIVTVLNDQSGSGGSVTVDVVISWDPAFEECPRAISPFGYNLQSGSCSWYGKVIGANVSRLFVIELQRIQTGDTFAVATAHDAANEDWDTDSVQMPP